MTVAVLTSVYGDYDVRTCPPRQTVDAEWICVTDIDREILGWTVVVEPRPDLHPRLAAKVPKCLPWLYTNADVTVWIDGACQLTDEHSLKGLLAEADQSTSGLTQFVHPWRSCVADEALASVGLLKYQGRPVVEQANHYMKTGHPPDWGLWATGLIIRAGNVLYRRRLMDFGRHWLTEQVVWSYQDQISQPPLLRHCGLRPHEFSQPLHGNPWVSWANHRDEL